MGILETIMIYAIAFLFVAPHLGMVLAVIWTVLSPGVTQSKGTNSTPIQKHNCSTAIHAQNRRQAHQNSQRHMRDTSDQASRMAQDAHDTATREAWSMHENADCMAQSAHDSAAFDHQAAVETHDNFASDPGFGCGPFF